MESEGQAACSGPAASPAAHTPPGTRAAVFGACGVLLPRASEHAGASGRRGLAPSLHRLSLPSSVLLVLQVSA